MLLVSQAREAAVTANKDSEPETLGLDESLMEGAENAANACTKVQVFHSWYREKQAKTAAKVASTLICFFSITYVDLERVRPVLGAKFGAKNVTCVPSVFCRRWCQMGQVWGAMDPSDRLGHLRL
jgi:hypothetical protein